MQRRCTTSLREIRPKSLPLSPSHSSALPCWKNVPPWRKVTVLPCLIRPRPVQYKYMNYGQCYVKRRGAYMKTSDRYQVVDEKHGEGGFGKVSKQRDVVLDRFVAVKELHLPRDAASEERFEREARLLARLSHPNIPAIYDVKFDSNEMRIYFEFVEGESLRSIIQEGAFPNIEDARRWFAQIASALEHAHTLNVIHRDVKPDNIIISLGRRTATLVDFGIAFSADEAKRITKDGYVIGTPAYMSPEQREGHELTGASDFFSLGITFYETLSGYLPQPGNYQSLAEGNEAIPPAFDDLIKGCLVHEPSDRLASAEGFVRQLRLTVRTDAPLSQLLTQGRLHEVLSALRELDAEEFKAKPRGQKLLIVNRLKDLMRADQPSLHRATVEMIAVLVRLARHESPDEYRAVVDAAFVWGFQKEFGEKWQGDRGVRESLVDTVRLSGASSHGVISESFISFVGELELQNTARWFLHELREVAMSLLANPSCAEANAEGLAKLYNEINEASHATDDEVIPAAADQA